MTVISKLQTGLQPRSMVMHHYEPVSHGRFGEGLQGHGLLTEGSNPDNFGEMKMDSYFLF